MDKKFFKLKYINSGKHIDSEDKLTFNDFRKNQKIVYICFDYIVSLSDLEYLNLKNYVNIIAPEDHNKYKYAYVTMTNGDIYYIDAVTYASLKCYFNVF